MSESIFRKASLNSISSPEQLNEYIKVSTPAVWIVLSAMLILLAAVVYWGLTGSLATTVSANCAVVGGPVVCYVNIKDAATIQVGQSVMLSGGAGTELRGKVVLKGETPLSLAEIAGELKSDYLVDALAGGKFAVKVTIAAEGGALSEHALVSARIVTDSIRPADFLTK